MSTNATARAALAASADKLVDKADGILEKNGSLLDRIYETVKKKVSTIDLPKDARTAAANSAALKKAIQDDTTHPVPPDFITNYDAAEKEAIDAYYKDRRRQCRAHHCVQRDGSRVEFAYSQNSNDSTLFFTCLFNWFERQQRSTSILGFPQWRKNDINLPIFTFAD